MNWNPVSQVPPKTGKYLVAIQPHFGWARAAIGWWRESAGSDGPSWSDRGVRYWAEIPSLPDDLLEPKQELSEFDPVRFATETARRRGLVPH